MPLDIPLGLYVGNPNGNDAAEEGRFEQGLARFTALMGRQPSFMNAFVNFYAPPEAWVADAERMAWSWTMASKGVGFDVNASITPVIGIPMARPELDRDAFFAEIIAGTYDQVYEGIAAAWADGRKTLYFRPGYEFNGDFMAWGKHETAARQAQFKLAFQRVAAALRRGCAKFGATCLIVWNPTAINWTAQPVEAGFPGVEFVDVIGIDVYAPCWPGDTYDYSLGRVVELPVWLANPVNRRHFWDHPSATQWAQDGRPGVGYSLAEGIALARRLKLPFCIPETGAGGRPDGVGPRKDPVFPTWLAERLAGATDCLFVNVWGTDQNDGPWGFLYADGTTDTEMVALAASWRAALGGAGGLPPSSVMEIADPISRVIFQRADGVGYFSCTWDELLSVGLEPGGGAAFVTTATRRYRMVSQPHAATRSAS